MSISLPQILEQSPTQIFFAVPSQLEINESFITTYMTNQKIEILIQELKEKGPLVGVGNFGSAAYVSPAFKLKEQVCGFDIYGWQLNAVASHPKSESILILGANTMQGNQTIYFMLSQELTTKREIVVTTHQPSKTDTNIYAVSHQIFCSFLTDLYLPNSNASFG